MGLKDEYRRYSRHVTRTKRWQVLRQAALRRDGFRCVQCGARGRLEVDHIKPVRTAPELSYVLENLQCLCPRCHTRKTRAEIGMAPIHPDRLKWFEAVESLEKSSR